MRLLCIVREILGHIVVLVSAGISYVAVVLALTAFVTSPATDRPCRVRGWLLQSKAVMLGCMFYFSSHIALRALAVAVIGYAPDSGTAITVGGQVIAEEAGAGLFESVLRLWMGADPVSENVAEGLSSGTCEG